MTILHFLDLLCNLKFSKNTQQLVCSLKEFNGKNAIEQKNKFINFSHNIFKQYQKQFNIYILNKGNIDQYFYFSQNKNILFKFNENKELLYGIKKLRDFIKNDINKSYVQIENNDNIIKKVEDYAFTQNSHNIRKSHNTIMYLTEESHIPKLLLLYNNKIDYDENSIKSFDNLIIIENKESFFRYKEFINLDVFDSIPDLKSSIIIYSSGTINSELKPFFDKFKNVHIFVDYDKAGFDMFDSINHINKKIYFPKKNVLKNIINLITNANKSESKDTIFTTINNIDYINFYNSIINNQNNDKFIFIEQEILLSKNILSKEVFISNDFSKILFSINNNNKNFFLLEPLNVDNIFSGNVAIGFSEDEKLEIKNKFNDIKIVDIKEVLSYLLNKF